ncbi:unnamed protein product, partial [Clonostachys rosea]
LLFFPLPALPHLPVLRISSRFCFVYALLDLRHPLLAPGCAALCKSLSALYIGTPPRTVTYISRLVATSETACPTHPDSHKPSVLSHPPKCRTVSSPSAFALPHAYRLFPRSSPSPGTWLGPYRFLSLSRTSLIHLKTQTRPSPRYSQG